MAYDKIVDSGELDENLSKIADACRRVKTKAQYEDLVDQAVISRHITISLDELCEGCTYIGAKCFMNTDFGGETTIPEGITTIEYEAFQNCGISKLTLPKSLKTFDGTHVFYGNAKLTTVTFQSKPSWFPDTTFLSCSKLTDIYVPWSEGEVANAPWGATNATIHYDCEVV